MQGWTDTGNYARESLLLELTAPTTYGDASTRVWLLALPYDVKTDFGSSATAHSIAADEVARHDYGSSQAVATQVADCSVATEPAALFGYADTNETGYRLLIVHHDRLFEIRLFGAAGLGDHAIADVLAMIGSITWTF